MFFDDRLATVLRQRATSEASARTQFRQLLDILGNRKFKGRDEQSGSLIAAAWLRMDALSQQLKPADRAAMIRERGWRFRSPDLAAHLADYEPEVASAALNRAHLEAEDWEALIPRLPVRARGFLRLRRDLPLDTEKLLERLGVHDRGLPRPGEEFPAREAKIFKPTPEPEPEGEERKLPPLVVGDDEDDRGDDSADREPVGLAGQDPQDANTDEETIEPPSESEPENTSTPDDPTTFVNDAPFPLPEPFEPEPVKNIAAQSPSSFAADEKGRSEISALVERIAQFQRTREVDTSDSDRMPRLPLEEVVQPGDRLIQAFGFSTDAYGRIDWAENHVASMVIGTRLSRRPVLGANASESLLDRSFQRRQPIMQSAFSLSGASAIVGEWLIDARPNFTEDGSFAGYLGRFRRPHTSDADGPSAAAQEADQIRQLLHELRTPVTAVQGYAEVIQQQLFGPAPHDYRALAASIAADAARILSGFEELDRLAKFETKAISVEPGEADLAAIASTISEQLAQVLDARMAGIELEEPSQDPVVVALDPDDAEILLWRLLATLASCCSSGEILGADIAVHQGNAVLSCELPVQLMEEDDPFAAEVRPSTSALNAGLFGAGFALRLARAEARSAGGTLTIADETITLTLPLLTGAEAVPSPIHGGKQTEAQ